MISFARREHVTPQGSEFIHRTAFEALIAAKKRPILNALK